MEGWVGVGSERGPDRLRCHPLGTQHRSRLHASRVAGAVKEAAGLPGDSNLGAGSRDEKLAAVTAQNQAVGLDSERKKVGEEMKEPIRPSECHSGSVTTFSE